MRFIIGIVGLTVSLICQAHPENLRPQYRFMAKADHEIHLLEFSPKDYKIKLVKAPNGERNSVLEISKAHHALAAINAGFFHTGEGREGKPAGILKIKQQWLGYNHLPRGALGWNENSETVLVDRITAKKNKLNAPQINPSKWQHMSYIVQGTPLLIKNGKIIKDYRPERTTSAFLYEAHARTAVCIKPNHHWLFLVASHTKDEDKPYVQKPVRGLTIPELSAILLNEGCWDAVNLDGGGSTTLVIDNHVMNRNAGDRAPLGETYIERPVSDAIIVTQK